MNNILENRIVNLEKQLSKNEQYGRRNNVEVSGISNDISDQDLEDNIVKICKDSDINISSKDIEGFFLFFFSIHYLKSIYKITS